MRICLEARVTFADEARRSHTSHRCRADHLINIHDWTTSTNSVLARPPTGELVMWHTSCIYTESVVTWCTLYHRSRDRSVISASCVVSSGFEVDHKMTATAESTVYRSATTSWINGKVNIRQDFWPMVNSVSNYEPVAKQLLRYSSVAYNWHAY